MISADVIGRRGLDGNDENALRGLVPAPPFGEDGAAPTELALLDGDFLIIFNPKVLFTLLVTAVPAPGGFAGDPGCPKLDPDPLPSFSSDGL